MNKIIFLDIDGVLATMMSCRANQTSLWSIDPTKIKALAETCRKLDVYWVISSTWRIGSSGGSFHTLLDAYGCGDRLFVQSGFESEWCTPQLSTSRGYEIAKWLDTYGKFIGQYLILDDDSDMLTDQMKHFLQTDAIDGLSMRNLIQIEKYFIGEKDWREASNFPQNKYEITIEQLEQRLQYAVDVLYEKREEEWPDGCFNFPDGYYMLPTEIKNGK